jgi:YbgC/YbaW family acyl-CoA thioester hydrolase
MGADLGIDQGKLKAEAGIVFAVRRVEADYLAPARFDDLLTVETDLVEATAARVVLSQRVLRARPLFASRSPSSRWRHRTARAASGRVPRGAGGLLR